ncbi:MAG: DNA-binding transcriptional regulator, LysR family [Glomeribacter sp. 1016415]|nr:DNA-binding transcriptional regulator, LysR family [Glomeribacter sp. 1016415]
MAINQYRLRYFQAVYNYGKIRKAADYLNTDSSVITRQIRLLEEEIGYKLFERRPRGVAPTGAAESLLEYYRRNQEAQADFEASLQKLGDLERGSIQLAIPYAYIDMLMKDVLNNFCLEHPNLNICVKEINAAPQIIAEILDDAVHIGAIHPVINHPDICCRGRISLPIHLLVGKDHPLATKQKIKFSEAARYPLALPPTSWALRQLLQLVESSEKIQLTPTLISDSTSVRKEFARIGSGGTFMPGYVARQEIEAGQLIALEIDHPAFTASEFGLIVKRGRQLSPAVNQLVRLITTKLSIFTHTNSLNGALDERT